MEEAVEEYCKNIKEFKERHLLSVYYFEVMLCKSLLYKDLLFRSPRYGSINKGELLYSFSNEVRKWMYQYLSYEGTWTLGKKTFGRTYLYDIYGEREEKLKQYLLQRLEHAYKIKESQPKLLSQSSKSGEPSIASKC